VHGSSPPSSILTVRAGPSLADRGYGAGCAGGPRKSPLREGPKFGHLAGEKIGRLPKPMAPLTLTADETADVIQCRASLGQEQATYFPARTKRSLAFHANESDSHHV
jgi:hypothetical protein